MARIFISYRRDDSAGYVGHLREKLGDYFGTEEIFRDIDTIEPGQDFVEVIEKAVGSCEVLLAVIGKQWLTLTDHSGKRRLDNPHDLVRLEIATALQRDIRVIPILVGGATMPSTTALPDDLLSLARRNAQEISDRNFQHDVESLILTIEKILNPVDSNTIETTSAASEQGNPDLTKKFDDFTDIALTAHSTEQTTLRLTIPKTISAFLFKRAEIFVDGKSVSKAALGQSNSIQVQSGLHTLHVVLFQRYPVGEVKSNLLHVWMYAHQEMHFTAKYDSMNGTLTLEQE